MKTHLTCSFRFLRPLGSPSPSGVASRACSYFISPLAARKTAARSNMQAYGKSSKLTWCKSSSCLILSSIDVCLPTESSASFWRAKHSTSNFAWCSFCRFILSLHQKHTLYWLIYADSIFSHIIYHGSKSRVDSVKKLLSARSVTQNDSQSEGLKVEPRRQEKVLISW